MSGLTPGRTLEPVTWLGIPVLGCILAAMLLTTPFVAVALLNARRG